MKCLDVVLEGRGARLKDTLHVGKLIHSGSVNNDSDPVRKETGDKRGRRYRPGMCRGKITKGLFAVLMKTAQELVG